MYSSISGVPPYGQASPPHLSDLACRTVPICFSMSAASSAVARGKMPGSVKLVLSRETITNTKSTPPITGMKTVRCSTRKGQLWGGKRTCAFLPERMGVLQAPDSLECKEKATRDDNEGQGHREDTALPGQDESPITEKPVFPRERFPLPPRPPRPLPGAAPRGRGRHGQRPRVDLPVLAALHGAEKGTKQSLSPPRCLRAAPFKYRPLYADVSLDPTALSGTS